MMPPAQRDLLLVPIPFSDFTSRKLRPVVVLSNTRYNREGFDLLVAGVTSNLSTRAFAIELDTPQLDEGTMRRPSLVRADKIFSIAQSIVVARIGRVNQPTLLRIRESIRILLDEPG